MVSLRLRGFAVPSARPDCCRCSRSLSGSGGCRLLRRIPGDDDGARRWASGHGAVVCERADAAHAVSSGAIFTLIGDGLHRLSDVATSDAAG